VLLERDRVGSTWAAAYCHLRLHTRRGAAALPGMRYPRGTAVFPRAAEVHGYLRDYAERFGLDVREGVEVTAAAPAGEGWCLTTSAGPWRSRVVVWAAGIWSSPPR